jgi:hypothetical protein
VDSKCAPNGPIANALGITSTMAIGLEITAEAEVFEFVLIDALIPNDLIALGVYNNWTLGKDCVDKNGIKAGKPIDTMAKSLGG